jgi:hypothetical protein
MFLDHKSTFQKLNEEIGDADFCREGIPFWDLPTRHRCARDYSFDASFTPGESKAVKFQIKGAYDPRSAWHSSNESTNE